MVEVVIAQGVGWWGHSINYNVNDRVVDVLTLVLKEVKEFSIKRRQEREDLPSRRNSVCQGQAQEGVRRAWHYGSQEVGGMTAGL